METNSNFFKRAINWFLGFFGYKREGKFAHFVWSLFALSATIIAVIFAIVLLYSVGNNILYEYHKASESDHYYTLNLNDKLSFYKKGKNKGYIFLNDTKKTTLTHVAWIAKPAELQDTLYCYSDGQFRGYFNAKNGEPVIPAKYTHAWVFSDGIASVEENGIVKFIDGNGKQAFNTTFPYVENMPALVFHGGYCIVYDLKNGKCGLMDRTGKLVLGYDYSEITVSCNAKYWILNKDKMTSVIDKDLHAIIPMQEGSVYMEEENFELVMPDNTIRRFSPDGTLIDDFYVTEFEPLEYETAETYQTKDSYYDENGDEKDCLSEPFHKNARAKLFKYGGGNCKYGLMTPEGHMVTLPKYEDIEAVGPDTYLCTVYCDMKEVLNGKGEKIR